MGAVAVVAAGLVVAPPVSSADTYLFPGPAELVDRADGPQGASALHHTGQRVPGAISGDGRWSAFAVAEGRPGDGGYHQSFVLRDIRDNRTYEVVHDGTSTPTSIDRNNRLVAFTSDAQVTSDDVDSTTDLFVLDLTNGRKALVSRASGTYGTPGTATSGLVSGDGDSVVFSGTVKGLGPGVFRRDLLTGATTRLAGALSPGERLSTVSDDGSVVGTAAPLSVGSPPVGGRVLQAGHPTITATGVVRVSPDGSTAAWVEPPSGGARADLTVLALRTGAMTSTSLPLPGRDRPEWFTSTRANVLWISPDGLTIAVAPGASNTSAGAQPAPQLWTRDRGFTEITSAFAAGLRADDPQPMTAVSRTAEFALAFRPSSDKGLYAVNLLSGELPGGGGDQAPAGEYLRSAGLACSFTTPATWVYDVTPGSWDWVRTPVYNEHPVRVRLSVGGTALYDSDGSVGKPSVFSQIPLKRGTTTVQVHVWVDLVGGGQVEGDWTETVRVPSGACTASAP